MTTNRTPFGEPVIGQCEICAAHVRNRWSHDVRCTRFAPAILQTIQQWTAPYTAPTYTVTIETDWRQYPRPAIGGRCTLQNAADRFTDALRDIGAAFTVLGRDLDELHGARCYIGNYLFAVVDARGAWNPADIVLDFGTPSTLTSPAQPARL